MSWRTVIISNQAKLDYKMGYLVIRGCETKRVAIDEIATLLIENPRISITGCLMEILIEKKIKVVFCDSKRNPIGEMLPYHGSHDSTAKIRKQVSWSTEAKGQVWRYIIQEKIRKQARVLEFYKHPHEAELLLSYLPQVELLDATNREGHAAKVYFNALFGMDFSRGSENAINAALNYGYSMILSGINREIAANGYINQLGIFHNNMFNHFNLGCDLMEPFRVLVDLKVVQLMPNEFGKDERHELWKMLDDTVIINGAKQNVSNAMKIYTRSVLEAINTSNASFIQFYSFEKL